MSSPVDRRRFLQLIGSGVAIATIPGHARGGWGRSPLLGAVAGEASCGAYFERFGVSSTLLRRVLERGLAGGGAFCEVYLEHSISRALVMEDGQVNRAAANVDLGAGIRVLKGDATGYAFSEDLSEKALLAAAAAAAAVADAGDGPRPVPLRASSLLSRYAVEVPWNTITVDRKLPFVIEADRAARAADPRITKVSVSLRDETSRVLIANSEGLLVEDDRPMVSFFVLCTARQGDRTETGNRSASGRETFAWLTPELVRDIAHGAVEHTVALFDAVPAPAGTMPVVLAAGTSGILLHEAIGHGMEADFNRKGTSIYASRLGQRISSPEVTIQDDGTLGRLRGSLNVDDEGTPAQNTTLVEGGILRSYLHDRISAAHYGVERTGSGRRQSFRHPPVPRMRNTLMLAGPRDPQEIIASVEAGLYAEEFANGQVDIGGGDFTFYLQRGRLIEHGRLTAVVKDCNLIGNGPKVLEEIDLVGHDFAMTEEGGSCGKDGQFVPVSYGLPTVRAGAITVGGRRA